MKEEKPKYLGAQPEIEEPGKPVTIRKPILRSDFTKLLFTPYSWAKYEFMCHAVDTEACGLGIAGDPEHEMLITDIIIPRQKVTSSTCEMDMEHIHQLLPKLCDPDLENPLSPAQFMRIWLHTHPCGICRPSSVDERTFAEVYDGFEWALMVILSKGGEFYSRFRGYLKNDRPVAWEIPHEVTFRYPFEKPDTDQWAEEMRNNLRQPRMQYSPFPGVGSYRSSLNRYSNTFYSTVPDDPDFPMDDCLDDPILGNHYGFQEKTASFIRGNVEKAESYLLFTLGLEKGKERDTDIFGYEINQCDPVFLWYCRAHDDQVIDLTDEEYQLMKDIASGETTYQEFLAAILENDEEEAESQAEDLKMAESTLASIVQDWEDREEDVFGQPCDEVISHKLDTIDQELMLSQYEIDQLHLVRQDEMSADEFINNITIQEYTEGAT